MKKILFMAAIAALSTTSCSKDRVCTCSGASGTEYKTTLVKVSGGQAKANCVTTKSTDAKGNVTTYTCKLD